MTEEMLVYFIIAAVGYAIWVIGAALWHTKGDR